MIRKLTLRNWRNYTDVTVNFSAGTTFVVASNGVGKTSLVEAARWALFGKIAPGGNAAVRAGAASAVAVVELELPDLKILSVERALTSKPRSAAPHPVVHLDGAQISHEELNQILTRSYGAEPGFLSGLTMPAVNRDHENPSALGLEDHLGRYYGIDSLRKAVDRLKVMLKENDRRIKRIKSANSASSAQLVQLQIDVDQAAHSVETATEAHKALQVRVDAARERERQEADLRRWQENNAAWSEAAERLALQISEDFGQLITVDSFERALEETLSNLNQQIETVRVDAAVNQVKETALTTNEERLNSADSDCPVCRRPLDEATVKMAHDANLRDLSTIRESILELKEFERKLLGQRERVRTAQNEWQRIPQPGKQPQVLAVEEDGATAAELSSMTEVAVNTLVDARTAHAQAATKLAEARAADDAMRELESLFRQEASLTVAVETAESTLTELLRETIRPLAAEVDQRWKALFPNRGSLKTDSDGNITRTVNGHSLPYDSFSTGESMGATILLRLLVAQMATKADFCWFDEPLEHLDPDVRRHVASLLSRVTNEEGRLKQVVVTTYEEPLARQLWARDEQRVTLLDVRHAG